MVSGNLVSRDYMGKGVGLEQTWHVFEEGVAHPLHAHLTEKPVLQVDGDSQSRKKKTEDWPGEGPAAQTS